jgi:hypothetical protein
MRKEDFVVFFYAEPRIEFENGELENCYCFNSFDEVVSYYKSNLMFPQFNSTKPISESEQSVILDIWNKYGDLL